MPVRPGRVEPNLACGEWAVTPYGGASPRAVEICMLGTWPPIASTLEDARRIAVRAQLLDAPRPTDLLAVVDRLTMLQLDPTAAIAPSADLVAWSRLGSAYQPADLQHALEQDRTLFELDAVVRPMGDLRLYLADMATWPTRERRGTWMQANDRFRRDILERLGDVRAAAVARHPGHEPGRRGRRRAGRTTATSPRCSSS